MLYEVITVVGGIFLLLGLWLTFLRFTGGLGAVTNLDDNNPWGIWIGFDLLCGVALAAGGYTTSAARITSYNVCYTKLLRSPTVISSDALASL